MKKTTVFSRILLFVLILMLLAACGSRTQLTPGQEVELTQEALNADAADGDNNVATPLPPTTIPTEPEPTADSAPVVPEINPTITPETAAPPPTEGGDTPTAGPPTDASSNPDVGGGTEETNTSSAGETTYVAQNNDNLFRIGLDNGCTTEQMSAANNIAAPYIIYVGQTIIIPDCK